MTREAGISPADSRFLPRSGLDEVSIRVRSGFDRHRMVIET
jgi:hypothetical protein